MAEPFERSILSIFRLFLDIMEKGENILRNMGFLIDKKRQGGLEHEYWKHGIAGLLKGKGYRVEVERPIGEGEDG